MYEALKHALPWHSPCLTRSRGGCAREAHGDGRIEMQTQTVMGNNSMCLGKGIGIGKASRARRGCGQRITTYVLLFMILSIGFVLTLFYTKPVFVMTEDVNNKKVLDWVKLAIYTSLFMIILAFSLRIIFAKFR